MGHYTAGPNGRIEVIAGKDGMIVRAIPDKGYRLSRWTDDYNMAAPGAPISTERPEEKDVEAEALFEPDVYRHSYHVFWGGAVEGDLISIDGMPCQVVPAGEIGVRVTAVPDVGFVFVGWSDGLTVPERTDPVRCDMALVAHFIQEAETHPVTQETPFVFTEAKEFRRDPAKVAAIAAARDALASRVGG